MENFTSVKSDVQSFCGAVGESIFVFLGSEPKIDQLQIGPVAGVGNNPAQQTQTWRMLPRTTLKCRLIPEPAAAKTKTKIERDRGIPKHQPAVHHPTILRKQAGHFPQKCAALGADEIAYAPHAKKSCNVHAKELRQKACNLIALSIVFHADCRDLRHGCDLASHQLTSRDARAQLLALFIIAQSNLRAVVSGPAIGVVSKPACHRKKSSNCWRVRGRIG